MKRRTPLLLAVLLLASAGALFLWSQTNPTARETRRIQKRLASLASDLSFQPGDSTLARVAYPSRVASHFAESTRIELNFERNAEFGARHRSEIEARAAVLRGAVRGLSVQFLDIAVTLLPQPSQATAHLTARVQVHGDADYWVQEFKFDLSRLDHRWQIVGVANVETLEH